MDSRDRLAAARFRVAVYVTRETPEARQLLVFEHVDHPEAGTQVPAGGVRPGERLSDAVIREAREEVGVAGLALGDALAIQVRPHPVTRQERITVFFHAQTSDRRDTWTHSVGGSDADAGLMFVCSFVPLGRASQMLVDAQGEFLGMIDTPAGASPLSTR